MKLSVVIPAYNEELLIGPCIEAVKRSIDTAGLVPEEYEVIVVNNASTDRTKEIASGFNYVRVVDEPHKGLTRAKQAGFMAAEGEILAHPDADTRMPESWVAQVLNEFGANPRLVALSGPYVYYDLPLYARGMTNVFYGFGFATHLVMRDVLRTGAMIQGGNYAVRRGALEAAGGYDTSIEFYGEDFDLARRISKKGKVKWTWQLPMYSSGRRLANEGILMTGIRYGANNMASTFLKRPLTQVYKDVRPGSEEK